MSAPNPPETVDILRLAPGGEGVARRANGEVMFVAGTALGDRVEVDNIKRSQGTLRSQLLRIITPSADRREPPCPHAGECGGCDFMHLLPEAQRREKIAILEDALERVGSNPKRRSQIGFVSASPASFRSRLRLHVDQDGQVGMFSARSHRVVPIERCLVSDATLNHAIAQLSALDAKAKKRLSYCEQIELRSAESPPTLALRLLPRKGAKLRAELYVPMAPPGAAVVVAGSNDDDLLTQDYLVTSKLSVRIPLSAFSQVRSDVNRRLVQAVVEVAERRNHRTFLDAYAGAGNFALPLLCAGLEGQAVDAWGPAILAARAVARDLGLPFAGFDIGDAHTMLEHFAKAKRQFDYIILDPPRQGAKSALEAALDLRPRTITFVACDPVSLARDLGTLTSRGARIDSLTLFDMFPETHHSETLAVVDCA